MFELQNSCNFAVVSRCLNIADTVCDYHNAACAAHVALAVAAAAVLLLLLCCCCIAAAVLLLPM